MKEHIDASKTWYQNKPELAAKLAQAGVDPNEAVEHVNLTSADSVLQNLHDSSS
jgi:hypothetical protein